MRNQTYQILTDIDSAATPRYTLTIPSVMFHTIVKIANMYAILDFDMKIKH